MRIRSSDAPLYAGALLGIAGAALFLAPVPVAEPAALEIAAAFRAEAPPPSGLSALFDRRGLPEPVAETPAAPTVSPLASYIFLGGARSGDRSRALFSAGGRTVSLAPGDDLEGFTLTGFDEEGARFERDGRTETLPGGR